MENTIHITYMYDSKTHVGECELHTPQVENYINVFSCILLSSRLSSQSICYRSDNLTVIEVDSDMRNLSPF